MYAQKDNSWDSNFTKVLLSTFYKTALKLINIEQTPAEKLIIWETSLKSEASRCRKTPPSERTFLKNRPPPGCEGRPPPRATRLHPVRTWCEPAVSWSWLNNNTILDNRCRWLVVCPGRGGASPPKSYKMGKLIKKCNAMVSQRTHWFLHYICFELTSFFGGKVGKE